MGADDPAASFATSLINEGLHLVEVSSPNGWPWLKYISAFSTVSGTDSYAFATIDSSHTIAKLTDVKVLSDANYVPLTLVSQREANRDVVTTTTGFPSIYRVEGGSLYLSPTPDAIYSISVNEIVTEPDLVSANDTPLMPSQYHGSIISAALVLYYQTLQDVQRAAAADQILNGWIHRMRQNSAETEGGTRVRVRDWLYTGGGMN